MIVVWHVAQEALFLKFTRTLLIHYCQLDCGIGASSWNTLVWKSQKNGKFVSTHTNPRDKISWLLLLWDCVFLVGGIAPLPPQSETKGLICGAERRRGRSKQKEPGTGAPLCCWSRGVTLEIGTGLSWGRLPEWLAGRTERPLSELCAKKCWAKQALTPPHPSSSPPTPTVLFFFSFSLRTHTNAYTHTRLYLPAVPGGGGEAFASAGGRWRRGVQSLFCG